MTHLKRAHHFGITVSNLDVSVAFYRDILGFDEVFRWNPKADYVGILVGHPSVDLHAAVLRLPDDEVSLELLEYREVDTKTIDADNANTGTSHLAFYVDDLDGLWARWEGRVTAVSGPVTPTIGPNAGGRAVYLIDPDGVRIELIETAGSFAHFAASQHLDSLDK